PRAVDCQQSKEGMQDLFRNFPHVPHLLDSCWAGNDDHPPSPGASCLTCIYRHNLGLANSVTARIQCTPGGR
ncbi:unnamed protein product, partial [Candidula unifasciata]